MKKTSQKLMGTMLAVMGHLSAVFGIAAAGALLIVPLPHLKGVASQLGMVDRLWDMSAFAVFLHIGLASCLWALTYILFQLSRVRASERKTKGAIRLQRGSVMTETLVIMPIYLLLTFGMGQLAINNVGGILANVAAYEAARAAWVWKPEAEAGRMAVNDDVAIEKCRIAIAFVMMPVAPGDFLKLGAISSLGPYANKARMVAFGANIPGAGIISTNLPDFAGELSEAGVAALALGTRTTNQNSYASTIDGSSFVTRTVRKFTQAYLGTECTIAADHSVTMKYKHLCSMPYVGRVFGSVDTVGGVLGHYTTYTRTFGFRKQHNTPNTGMPANNWISWESDGDPGEDTTFDTSGYE
jgi:hypothetical protein